MSTKDLISTRDMVRLLPFSLRHIQDRIVRRDDFPKPYRVGMRRFYKKTEVEAWWESKKQ